jgi:hypothetical protein
MVEMASERDNVWNEAARLCKKWLDAEEDYKNLLQKYYPLKQLPQMTLDGEILGNIEDARKRADEARKKYREAVFKVRS